MKKMPVWVNVLSAAIGVLVALLWTLFLNFVLAWIIDADWEYLWLMPNAVAGFLVPWGLVQVIARFSRHGERNRRNDVKLATGRVITTSILAGVVFAGSLTASCACLLYYSRLNELAYLWLIPVGIVSFIVPWGLVQLIERTDMHHEHRQR